MNKKVLLNVLASLSFAFSQWFIITYISREISVSKAGFYALCLAIFSPLSILCSFGLRNQIATDINNNFSRESYQQILFIGNILYLILSIFIVVYYGINFILLIVLIVKWIEINSEKIYGEWIKEGKTQLYSFSRIYKSLFTFIAVILLHLLKVEGEIILISYPLIYLLVFIFYDLSFSNSSIKQLSLDAIFALKDTLRRNKVRNLFLFSLPVVLSTFVVSVRVSVPRIILSELDSIEYVATFTLLIYFGSVAIIPLMSAFPVYMAKFAKHQDIRQIKKASKLINLYGVAFIIFMLLFASSIMQQIYKIDNYDYIDLIFATVIGYTYIIIVWLSFILTSMRKFKYLFKSNLLNLVVVTVLSIILGRYSSITGVLLSVLLANLILILANTVNIISLLRNTKHDKKLKG